MPVVVDGPVVVVSLLGADVVVLCGVVADVVVDWVVVVVVDVVSASEKERENIITIKT